MTQQVQQTAIKVTDRRFVTICRTKYISIPISWIQWQECQKKKRMVGMTIELFDDHVKLKPYFIGMPPIGARAQ